MRATIVLAALSACISPNDVFECTDTSQCSGGICQLDVGFCSFDNATCPSGQAYGPASGGLSNECVPTTAVCGNGVVEAGEDCEDGNLVDTDSCVACKFATCGDGKVRAGIEECDGDASCNELCITCTGDAVAIAGGHCYMRIAAPLAFEAARADCADRGGFLAAIGSAAENTTVTGLLPGGSGDHWFGLTNFSTGVFFGEDDEASTFMNFAPTEPNGAGAEDCGSLVDGTGLWSDRACATALPYVCEKAPWTIDATSRHAYLYIGGGAGQSEHPGASTACAAFAGGHLVTITDAAEQATVDAVTGASKAFIGLDDIATPGTFAWETGEATTFTNFDTAAGEPNATGDCVTLRPNGLWADDACTGGFSSSGFLCEIDP